MEVKLMEQLTKYGTSYTSPIGLSKEDYYELMYQQMEFIQKKGLTIRQAQKLFTNCADMVLDVKINDDKNNMHTNENIAKSLESIAYSLDYLVFDNKRSCDKRHPIPD